MRVKIISFAKRDQFGMMSDLKVGDFLAVDDSIGQAMVDAGVADYDFSHLVAVPRVKMANVEVPNIAAMGDDAPSEVVIPPSEVTPTPLIIPEGATTVSVDPTPEDCQTD